MSQSPFAATFASYPARLGVVRWSARRVTLIAKLTFEVAADGALRPLPWVDQEDVGLDRLAPGGELAWPSDFAPYKPSCDVVVTGDDPGRRGGAGMLEVGELARAIEPGESLAPREVFAPDPTVPEAFEAWTTGAVAATRFQCAPPDRRTSLLAAPFAVAFSRDGAGLRATLEGPWPSIALVDRDGRPLGRSRLAIDLVGIASARRRVTLVGRAVVDATRLPLEETVLVVQLDEGMPAGGWLTPTLITPRDAATASSSSIPSAASAPLATPTPAPSSASLPAPTPAPTVTSSSPRSAPAPEGTMVARTGAAPASRPLPFRAAAAAVVPAPSVGAPPPAPSAPWDDTGTRAAALDVARALPFRSAQVSPAPRDAVLGAPRLGIEELLARVVALDDEASPGPRATLAVDLERWADRLDDPSPTGPLAVLLHHG